MLIGATLREDVIRGRSWFRFRHPPIEMKDKGKNGNVKYGREAVHKPSMTSKLDRRAFRSTFRVDSIVGCLVPRLQRGLPGAEAGRRHGRK